MLNIAFSRVMLLLIKIKIDFWRLNLFVGYVIWSERVCVFITL